MSRLPRAALIGVAVGVAVVANLIVYLIGRAAGGTFVFTANNGPAEVDAATVAGFSLVPLLVGLAVVALLAPRAPWVVRAAVVIGPVLAIGTIVVMTLPADFDSVSTTTLALCHLTLVPITIAAALALGRRSRVAGG
ncbi:DUF6069 family protein [Actinoplanes sp. NPDC024001]|uniref:DUF6069 family protein n=1 Tax=Actinoplanes sp. NPDC024001 TaxID=3154598 RepID=UPI0033C91868